MANEPVKPHPAQMLATIHKCVDERRILYSTHALDRLSERGIYRVDVETVLRFGSIVGHIEAARGAGEWQSKIVGGLDRTSRKVGVVTVVLHDERLLIETTEWEDR